MYFDCTLNGNRVRTSASRAYRDPLRRGNFCGTARQKIAWPIFLESDFMNFEKRVFSSIPQVAEVLMLPPTAKRGLFEEGVPDYFFYRGYSADPGLTVISRAAGAPIVRFGSDGAGLIGVESVSGCVVRISGRTEEQCLVNVTVGCFTETARILTQRFPYYSDDTEIGEIEAAAEELRNIVRSVDPQAVVPGSYWAELIDEVDGLLFDAEDVRAWYRRRNHPP